ncbi:MAG: hypothetical protein ABIS67_00795 [Candidatus Eisenbacteria bacterium]
MLWNLAALLLLGAVPTLHSEARAGHEIPAPSVLDSLRSRHHRGDWMRITTDSARFEARVREIGAQSLSGLSFRRPPAALPESIPWWSVARLDRVRTNFRVGQVLGFAAGGALGLSVAGTSTFEDVRIVAIGAVGGALIGARLGDRQVRLRTLYVASPESDSSALARKIAGESIAAAGPPAPSEHSRPDSIRIARALPLLRPNRLFRIRGEFGEAGRVAEFEGFVTRAGHGGLEGLRPSRTAEWTTPLPQDLGWDRIGRIDRRGNRAGRGAFVGAMVLGVPGAVAGLAAGAVWSAYGGGGGGGEILVGALIGAAVGATIGAGFGALIGCAVPGWHMVYGRH